MPPPHPPLPADTSAQPLALVTGGTTGIGAAIADALSGDGYRVVSTQFADDASATWVSPHCLAIDSRRDDAPAAALDRVVDRFCRIYVLVNNAAIVGDRVTGLLIDMPEARIDEIVAVNLLAPTKLSAGCLRIMSAQRRGVIVTISSVHGTYVHPTAAVYSLCKAGLESLTRSLAVEAGSTGVRAVAVAPGWIVTQANPDPDGQPTALAPEASLRQPTVGGPGSVGDIAETVRFVCSPAAPFITGTVIRVDGGTLA